MFTSTSKAAAKETKQSEGHWPPPPLPTVPVAREDLLGHLDGDVTLLPPLVEIQQVGSEARGRLGSGACGEDVIMRTDRVAVTQTGCVPVCVTTLYKGFHVCVCVCVILFLYICRIVQTNAN